MRWNLGRRELIAFGAIIVFLEIIYIIGGNGPFWLVVGFVAPIAVLLGINAIVGAARRSRQR